MEAPAPPSLGVVRVPGADPQSGVTERTVPAFPGSSQAAQTFPRVRNGSRLPAGWRVAGRGRRVSCQVQIILRDNPEDSGECGGTCDAVLPGTELCVLGH